MFNFLKKGNECNRLAESFGIVYENINRFIPIYQNDLNGFRETYGKDILLLALIAHKGIIQRIDDNDFGMSFKLIIQPIGLRRITIMEAFSKTIAPLQIIVNAIGLESEYIEISESGPLCAELERIIPADLKNW